jgi:hypothetical protein
VSTTRTKHSIIAAIVACGLAAGVAGCSSSSSKGGTAANGGSPRPATPSDTASGTPGAPSTSAAQPTGGTTGGTADAAACQGSYLKVNFADAAPNPAATEPTARLVIQNAGSSTCSLLGYPGVQLVTAKGATWDLVREQYRKPVRVVLAPGQSTRAVIYLLPHENGYGTNGFAPATVRVTPPNTTSTVTLDWPWPSYVVEDQSGATRPGSYVFPVGVTP